MKPPDVGLTTSLKVTTKLQIMGDQVIVDTQLIHQISPKTQNYSSKLNVPGILQSLHEPSSQFWKRSGKGIMCDVWLRPNLMCDVSILQNLWTSKNVICPLKYNWSVNFFYQFVKSSRLPWNLVYYKRDFQFSCHTGNVTDKLCI